MIEVSFEEASECPQCGKTGRKDYSRPVQGSTRHKLVCMNAVCPWYNTSWYVETNGDGKVMVNEEAYNRARSEVLVAKPDPTFDKYFQAIHEQLGNQLRQETNGNQ